MSKITRWCVVYCIMHNNNALSSILITTCNVREGVFRANQVERRLRTLSWKRPWAGPSDDHVFRAPKMCYTI